MSWAEYSPRRNGRLWRSVGIEDDLHRLFTVSIALGTVLQHETKGSDGDGRLANCFSTRVQHIDGGSLVRFVRDITRANT